MSIPTLRQKSTGNPPTLLQGLNPGTVTDDDSCCLCCETVPDSISVVLSGFSSAGCVLNGTDGSRRFDGSLDGVYSLSRSGSNLWSNPIGVFTGNLKVWNPINATCSGDPSTDAAPNGLDLELQCVDNSLTLTLFPAWIGLEIIMKGVGALMRPTAITVTTESAFLPSIITSGIATISW